MKKWSLLLGSYSGIKVYIHWTFMILIVWILLMNMRMGHSLIEGGWSLLFIITLFACVVLHEFGHALTAKRYGIKTRNITLYPIGGIASLEKMPEKPSQEFMVALAGPVVNILIAFFLWIYMWSTASFPDFATIETPTSLHDMSFVFNLFAANIILAGFNLIPAFPMDGGRILRALLAFKMDRGKATRIAASIGQLLAIFFVFIGVFSNFWLVLIGLFIYLVAGSESAMESSRQILADHTIRDVIMTKFSSLSPSDGLEKAVKLLLDGQDQEFVVIKDGQVVGILLRNDIIQGLTTHGKTCQVSQVMRTDYLTLSPEQMIKDIYINLITSKCSVFPVLENGSFLGIVDIENIQELILVNKAIRPSLG